MGSIATSTNDVLYQPGNPQENMKQQMDDATRLVREGIHRAYPQLEKNRLMKLPSR